MLMNQLVEFRRYLITAVIACLLLNTNIYIKRQSLSWFISNLAFEIPNFILLLYSYFPKKELKNVLIIPACLTLFRFQLFLFEEIFFLNSLENKDVDERLDYGSVIKLNLLLIISFFFTQLTELIIMKNLFCHKWLNHWIYRMFLGTGIILLATNGCVLYIKHEITYDIVLFNIVACLPFIVLIALTYNQS